MGELSSQMRTQVVHVIPWALRDAQWGQEPWDSDYRIFVGGLHGATTAAHLKLIMEETFGRVSYVKIDTDTYR